MSDKKNYLKIEPIDGGAYLVIDTNSLTALGMLVDLTMGEVGDEYKITVIELEPEEYKVLPEFDGF